MVIGCPPFGESLSAQLPVVAAAAANGAQAAAGAGAAGTIQESLRRLQCELLEKLPAAVHSTEILRLLATI